MFLYFDSELALRGIVSDAYAYEFSSDPEVRVAYVGDDIYCWMLVAVFQPLGEVQLPLW
jgi:hypothetical protein